MLLWLIYCAAVATLVTLPVKDYNTKVDLLGTEA
jgi:hypothetical protein